MDVFLAAMLPFGYFAVLWFTMLLSLVLEKSQYDGFTTENGVYWSRLKRKQWKKCSANTRRKNRLNDERQKVDQEKCGWTTNDKPGSMRAYKDGLMIVTVNVLH